MKKVLLIVLTLCFSGAIFLAWQAIAFLSEPPSDTKKEVIFEVPTGSSFYAVAMGLESAGLVTNARALSLYAKLTGQTTKLRVGEYRLYTNMLPREVLKELIAGKSISYPLTVPEGFNIFEIREALNNMWMGRGDEFFGLVTDRDFIKSITNKEMPSLEGYLFPDTYLLTKYTSTKELIKNMYDRFNSEITTINREPKVSMDLHKQVILASVIEKETGSPEERQLISSVFHNRLAKGMQLQSDPTILYGILVETKSLKKNISKEDIHRPTPYNTYTIRALPAGPISNPGREALYAALNPAQSNYLYFVSRNDGTHVFSENYENHNKAVKNFQINKKAREGKSWRDLKKKK